MKSTLIKIVFIMIFFCLAFGLSQTALAAETFVTTDGVRFRAGPSIDDAIISMVYKGTSVSVLEHDPAGWSMVKIDNSTGYIRSDFLMFPIGSSSATFRTTDDVRFRAAPSTDAAVIKTVVHGTSVEVLDHDPAGWSRVRINGLYGYIRSDFLIRDISVTAATAATAAATTAKVSQPIATLWTAEVVRLRAAPSTDAAIVSVLEAGVSVSVLEPESNNWFKVSTNGSVGYIRSDLLRTSSGKVEYLEWSAARNVVPIGVPIKVVDVRTGLSYTIQCFSKGGHADVEPLTAADTDMILQTRKGIWAWDPRPVWVTINGRTIAASLNGMPHSGSTISGNNMNGHLCLHFGGTVTENKSYQQDLRNAVDEAYKASQ